MFAYELPFIGSNKLNNESKRVITNLKGVAQPSIVVYNFHSMFYHNRMFIFSQHNQHIFSGKIQNNYYTLNSISELFPAGN
jgi:hypothetical protein